jgi:hypothetical protein
VWGENHPAKTKCAAEARAKKEAARLAKHEAKRLRGRP